MRYLQKLIDDYTNNQKEIGRTTDVMIIAIHDNSAEGYTDNMKNITISLPEKGGVPPERDGGLQVGHFAQVEITEGGSFRLQGVL